MKFLHISDLHLGKRLREFSLIEDQEYILFKIINIIDDEKPDAVLIAGDIYDKSIPPINAINLLDDFLTKISERKIPVFIINGNHDSYERISFGAKLMQNSGIFISKNNDEKIEPYVLTDKWGSVNIYLLPYVNPIDKSFTQAVETEIQKMNIDKSMRNVLVSHQLVTGAERSESEDLFIGGTENIDVDVFDNFDYVALGHIHKPQKCGREFIRYSGTPLKYSFSEVNHKKSVCLVELKEKGNLSVNLIPLVPKRDLHIIKGKFEELIQKSYYEKLNLKDFYKIILTDEDDIPEGFARLQTIYENLTFLDYENTRTKSVVSLEEIEKINQTNPLEIFKEFYEVQNNLCMTDEQIEFSSKLIKEVWDGEK